MVVKAVFLIANWLFASAYDCTFPTQAPFNPNLLDPEFGTDVVNRVESCFHEIEKKPVSTKLLFNLYPAFETLLRMNCIAEGFLEIGSTKLTNGMAKQIALIPGFGGDVVGVFKFLNADNTVNIINQELENLNETILCALNIPSQQTLDLLKKTGSITEHIRNNIELLKKEFESVKEKLSQRISEINDKLEVYWAKMDSIQDENLNGVQKEGLTFFSNMKFSLKKLAEAYKDNARFPDVYNPAFQHTCFFSYNPKQIIDELSNVILKNKQSTEKILEKLGYGDFVCLIYHIVMEVGDILYNCDMLTFEQKKIFFTGHAKNISDELMQIGNKNTNLL